MKTPMTTEQKEEKVRAAITAELEQVARRRHAQGLGEKSGGPPPADERLYQEAGKQALVGLAFSGGGIRSATFCLGVLQGLAGLTRSGLLKYVDYLSTVSGGGYIGSWFVAWVHRAAGRLAEVERLLEPRRIAQQPAGPAAPQGAAEDPPPILHLRRYSNYLAPRLGLLSADVWVLLATYLRNFLVCQLVLLPAAILVLLFSRLALLLYHPQTLEVFVPQSSAPSDVTDTRSADFLDTGEWCLGGAILALWLLAAFAAFLGSGRVRPDQEGAAPTDPAPFSPARLFWLIAVPLAVAAVLFCWIPAIELYKLDNFQIPFQDQKDQPLLRLSEDGNTLPAGTSSSPRALRKYLPILERAHQEFLAFALVPAFTVAVAYVVALFFHPRRRDAPVHLLVTFFAGMGGGVLLYFTCKFLMWLARPGPAELSDYVYARAAARVTTFGPPLVLAVIVLTVYFGIALLRNRLDDGLREWWSSLCARLMILALVWISIHLVAIYGTTLFLWASPWARAALGSGWLLTVLGGVLAGSTSRTDALKPRGGPLDWLARLAPHAFVVGLLISVSLLLHVLLDEPPNWKHGLETAQWARVKEPPYPPIRTTETRTNNLWGWLTGEHTEVVEQAKVVDEPALTHRVYWLGIFNTDPKHVPEPRFQLTGGDIDSLVTRRDLKLEVAEKLNQTRLRLLEESITITTPEDFKARYADALKGLPSGKDARPGDVTPKEVLEAATDASLIEFNPGRVLRRLGFAGLACALLLGLAAWRVDVNVFSLHALYRNRLTRCYLGASRASRDPDPITFFDSRDDLPLNSFLVPSNAHNAGYNGPYLLVNATLNLVGGGELAWQERKAESFLFSPLSCGSRDTGYCPTQEYAGGVSVSEAVTISGAAASPNAGYNSSPAVTALLTVFNARLGAWLGNPLRESRRRDRGPQGGFFYLLKELLGRTTSEDSYIYLSDGGHFENLGGYELVRRRCRYIVLVDADCDPEHQFENLGNLIRKCRIDFGIPIDIDLGSLRRAAEGRVRWHCAVGSVRYDAVDFGAIPGTLVYLKPSLTGDEPADVLHYATQHSDFPHETTANQFFTESQLESYRALGQHVAEMVFSEAIDDVQGELADLPSSTSAGERRSTAVRALFASVSRRWFALPPEYETSFLQTTHGYIDLQRTLADDARLRRLTLSMYPELEAALPAADQPPPTHPLQQALQLANAVSSLLLSRQGPSAASPPSAQGGLDVTPVGRACAEVHTLLQMLQIMENAWLSLNLDVHYAHPLNRGWMDVFYRWTSTPLFRRHWPVLRSEFARGFVSFCEKQVRMGRVSIELVPPTRGQVPEVLTREFAAQWPQSEGLQQRLDASHPTAGCWLIRARMGDVPSSLTEPPAGIILVKPEHQPPPGQGDPYALLIWVRGAYRNSGIGRAAALQVLNTFQAANTLNAAPLNPGPHLAQVLNTLQGPNGRRHFRLLVELPVGRVSGPGGRLLRAMWETFFYHLDFHLVYQVPTVPPGEVMARQDTIVLERCFPSR